MTKARYFLEAVLMHSLYFLFRLMPLDMASGLGGWLGRTIGPRLAASRKALKNIEDALPETPPAQRQEIITRMWDNLGRIIAEYPHFKKIALERMEIENEHLFTETFAGSGPAIFIGTHFGNWEVAAPAIYHRFGVTPDITYRALNNPWNERLLRKVRTVGGRLGAFPKARASSTKIVRALKDGHFIGILIDQKYNEGIAVPFFGRPAMTNPVFAQLALKYNCPLFPIQVVRKKGAHFTFRIEEPVPLTDPQTGEAMSVYDIVAHSHEIAERWIRSEPGQWLWLHRRWSDKAEQLFQAEHLKDKGEASDAP